MTTQEPQPGDIVFFEWSDEIADPNFTYFAHVAGFAQNLAYTDGVRRWHHHCGVIALDGDLVQFPLQPEAADRDPGSTDVYGNTLAKAPLDVPRGERIEIVRPTDPTAAHAIAAHAESMVGTPYNVGALLAFAFATQRRLFAQGKAKERLALLASGSHAIADGEGHTCVSAVLACLHASEGQRRVFKELEARSSRPVLRDGDPPVLSPVFESLFKTVATSRLATALADLGELEAIEQFTDEELSEGFGGAQFDSRGVADGALVPGFIVTTKQYLDLMTLLVRKLNTTSDRVSDVGSKNRLSDNDVPHSLVSPAMLRDALIADRRDGVPVFSVVTD